MCVWEGIRPLIRSLLGRCFFVFYAGWGLLFYKLTRNQFLVRNTFTRRAIPSWEAFSLKKDLIFTASLFAVAFADTRACEGINTY